MLIVNADIQINCYYMSIETFENLNVGIHEINVNKNKIQNTHHQNRI